MPSPPGLTRWSPKYVVLDPVMVATSGDRLLAAEAIDALRSKLIPCASMITPNLPEAAALLDEPVAESEAAVEHQGKRLLAMGCRAVLIKGGHGQGDESIDYLIDANGDARAGRTAHRHQEYPRHRLLAVVGHCCGSRERRRDWRPPCATPRPGSAPRSRPPTASASAMATGRSIIFISSTENNLAKRGQLVIERIRDLTNCKC